MRDVTDDDYVVELITNHGKHKAQIVVLAAGLGIPTLAKSLGFEVPLTDKAGTLTVIASPMPKILDHIIVTGDPLSQVS